MALRNYEKRDPYFDSPRGKAIVARSPPVFLLLFVTELSAR
jgi:hypothetical protein